MSVYVHGNKVNKGHQFFGITTTNASTTNSDVFIDLPMGYLIK